MRYIKLTGKITESTISESMNTVEVAQVVTTIWAQHYKCDLRIHKFSHKEYGEFIGKSFEMRNKYPEVGTNISALIAGRQKSCKGWTLVQGG